MRYPDGGGLTAVERARRERVRRQAAEMFAQDADPVRIARALRVSTKSVYAWRRAWRAGGLAGLASQGPGGFRCRLDAGQLAVLAAELDKGPAVHGWADQRWTLERAGVLIGRLFRVRYTPRGVSYLLHRMGYVPQRPVHRAAERDEGKIAAWRAVTWAKVRLAAAAGAWVCFEDETGQTLHPPKARTWARRGHAPVVRVCGKGSERVSVAGLVCVRPGHPGAPVHPGAGAPPPQRRAPQHVRS